MSQPKPRSSHAIRDSKAKYLNSLPDWIPLRYRQECIEIFNTLSLWLEDDEIRQSINTFRYIAHENMPATLANVTDINFHQYVDMIFRLREMEEAITLGEDKGVKYLDREDRSESFKASILSQSGSNAAEARDQVNADVQKYAIGLAKENLEKTPGASLSEIAANIAPTVFTYSKGKIGGRLRSEVNAPRTILTWLKNARATGKI